MLLLLLLLLFFLGGGGSGELFFLLFLFLCLFLRSFVRSFDRSIVCSFCSFVRLFGALVAGSVGLGWLGVFVSLFSLFARWLACFLVYFFV